MKNLNSLSQWCCTLVFILNLVGESVATQFSDRPSEPMNFTMSDISVVTPAKELFELIEHELFEDGELKPLLKSTAKIKAIIDGTLTARFFRLPETGDEPKSWLRIGDCYVYVFVRGDPVTHDFRSELHLMKFDKTWLDVRKGQPIKAGRFVVVFEEGIRNEIQNTFRLHKDSVKGYFQNGLIFTVKSKGAHTQSDVDEMAEKRAAKAKDREKVIIDNSDKYSCYKYKALTVSADDQNTTQMLAQCDSDGSKEALNN